MMLDRFVSRSSWLPLEKKGVLHLRVENLSSLVRMHGGENRVYPLIQDVVSCRLAGFGVTTHDIVFMGPDIFIDLACVQVGTWVGDVLFLERIKAAVSCLPVECGAMPFFLRMSATLDAERPDPRHAAPLRAPVDAPCAEEAALLQKDMATAVMLLNHLRAGRIVLAFQSVRHVKQPEREIYCDCQLWRYLERGALVPCEPEIQALERVDLVHRLDSSLLWTVIQLLEEQEDRHLACRISARSLQFDGWWRRLQDYLECHSRIAERLTLIVAGTASVMHVGDAVSMLDVMRILGCRIVIDCLSQLELADRIEPDAIKVSVEQLQGDAVASSQGWLIVAGIESRDQLAVAMAAGAHCVQGDFIARPGMLPAWRSRPVVLADSMAPQHRALHPDGAALMPAGPLPF